MLSSDVLFAFVRAHHSDFAKLSFETKPQAPYEGADVWLLASLLQKAVRRGDLQTARRAGHQLLGLDAPRLWRRIMTLALEDIGIGDVEVCATLVGIATSKETRRLLDPHALDVALALGCGARKDRSSDHLTSILRIAHTERDALAAASPNALLAVMASPRCGAKTRSGKACSAPAVRGKKRCRMHGGAAGSGAPKGNRNALKSGYYTREEREARKSLNKAWRDLKRRHAHQRLSGDAEL